MNNITLENEDNKDEYGFGPCKNCGKVTSLKNGYCSKCNDNSSLDFLKDIFGMK